jgi:hypothetical protein
MGIGSYPASESLLGTDNLGYGLHRRMSVPSSERDQHRGIFSELAPGRDQHRGIFSGFAPGLKVRLTLPDDV